MPKQPKSRKAVPLIFTKPPTTAAEKHHNTGEAERVRTSVEPPEGGWDSSYVPEYSDHKHMNEELRKQGKKPVDLPANLCWVPKSFRGMMPYDRKGYTVIDDVNQETGVSDLLQKHGWGMPPAATITPEGRIEKDDSYLAYVDAERHKVEEDKDLASRRFREGGAAPDSITMTTEQSKKVRLSSDDIV